MTAKRDPVEKPRYYAVQHAYARARERHGFFPTSDDFRGMVISILAALSGDSHDAKFIYAKRKREVWLVRCRKHTLRVCYDPKQARIITIFPQRGLNERDS